MGTRFGVRLNDVNALHTRHPLTYRVAYRPACYTSDWVLKQYDESVCTENSFATVHSVSSVVERHLTLDCRCRAVLMQTAAAAVEEHWPTSADAAVPASDPFLHPFGSPANHSQQHSINITQNYHYVILKYKLSIGLSEGGLWGFNALTLLHRNFSSSNSVCVHHHLLSLKSPHIWIAAIWTEFTVTLTFKAFICKKHFSFSLCSPTRPSARFKPSILKSWARLRVRLWLVFGK